MSSPLALAAVTAVLKDVLDNGLVDAALGAVAGPIRVTALPPDHIVSTAPETQSQVNLYLYRVAPNAAYANTALPARGAAGERLTNAPLALDLHYLLTAYGAGNFIAEALLGHAMHLFHETPVLARDAIRRLLRPSAPAPLATLATAELAEQVESVRLSPEAVGTEELARMWAAFGARYRPTAAYRASVVLIEARRPTRTALPVRQRNLYVVPLRAPFVERLRSQAAPTGPIRDGVPLRVGDRLVVEGRNLRGDGLRVLVGPEEAVPAPADVTDDRIFVDLPAGLRAGVQAVQVVHGRRMGTPEAEHRGDESNVAAFVLAPTILFALGPVTSSVVNGVTVFAGTVAVTFTPPVGRAQRVVLRLHEADAPPTRAPRAYGFPAPPRDPATDPEEAATLAVPFAGVRAGTYLVRAAVDGAESPLDVDLAEPPGPTFGRYTGPTLTLP